MSVRGGMSNKGEVKGGFYLQRSSSTSGSVVAAIVEARR